MTVSEALLDELIALAERAGRATLDWYQSSALQVEQKTDGTPVTEADKAAEHFIREHLAAHHAADGIIGEEEGTSQGTSGRTWYIDPIDGTRSFVHGVPLYATLLAVADPDGIAAGVIHLPALGDTVAAGRGLGCFWNGDRARVSDSVRLDGAVVSRSEYGTTPPDMLERLATSPTSQRTWGDAHGYALVATGRIDAMLDHAAHPWDLAPIAVIIPEAGGTFTDLNGQSGVAGVHGGSGLATNGRIHDELLTVVVGA